MAKSETSNGAQARGNPKRAMPLFYARPEPISAEGFKDKSLARTSNYAFARNTNSVPLNAAEFGVAQRHYPIVFGPAENPLPQAFVGLRNGENLFVGADGRWAERVYIPAYVRRYPFIFMSGRKPDELVLAADTASDLVVADASNPFFKDGKPGKFIAGAGKLCGAIQKEHEMTKRFCAALVEQELLGRKRVELESGGKKLNVGPVLVVDAAKLAALAEPIVAEWNRRGWLMAIHAHLFSLNNWADLAARMGTK